MSKNSKNRSGVSKEQAPEIAEVVDQVEQIAEQVREVAEVALPVVNHRLVKHMDHPNGRTSYTIEGNKGNLVIFNNLFLDGVAPHELLITNVALANPVIKEKKADKKSKVIAKTTEDIAALQERIRTEQAKLEEVLAKSRTVNEAATDQAPTDTDEQKTADTPSA